MTWFKVDDSLAFHAKVVAAGNGAMGLWVRAGAWCSQQLTDGCVPSHMVTALGKTAEARRLVDVGLWQATDDGFRFWQWDERNPRREEVEEERSAARERMRKARAAKRSGERQPNVPPNTGERSPAVAVTRPDPTRPESSPKTVGTRKRATPAPDLFPITAELVAWGRDHAPLVSDPKSETARFLDHHRAKGSVFKDWTAAWRNWMSKANEFASQRPGGRPPSPNVPDTDEWRLA